MKNFIKLNKITKDYIYNFLNENNLIGKYIDILYIKPSAVKYYFCKVDQQVNSENLTILEGFACEQSNLITKPACLTDDEYSLIPTDSIGIDYNIFYEVNPFLYKIYYTLENQSKKLLTVIESSRIIHIYTIIFSIDDLNDITDIADVFIKYTNFRLLKNKYYINIKMTLLSLEHIVGTNGYYIDDKDFKIYSFKRNNKNGKLIKGSYNKYGYIQYCFFVNGKRKYIFYHTIIVKMFINLYFDSS